MRNDPSLLEFDRFSFSAQHCVVTTKGASTYLELEYEYQEEASPPIHCHDSVLLDKEEVGRLINYLQEQLEKM